MTVKVTRGTMGRSNWSRTKKGIAIRRTSSCDYWHIDLQLGCPTLLLGSPEQILLRNEVSRLREAINGVGGVVEAQAYTATDE